MYTLKNNKLPKLYLKFHEYKIKRKNKQVIWYQKQIVTRDFNNYAMFYTIDILYHLQDDLTEILVSVKAYNPVKCEYMYDIYDSDVCKQIIKEFDEGLLKYIEEVKDE